MMPALLLFTVGILLSAFFSGSETGLYRVARPRLLVEALEGDRLARSLLWLIDNPTLFVATALVGNNLANQLASFAAVLAAAQWGDAPSTWLEIGLPLILAPIVFVFGELAPKALYYQAAHRMLRRTGWLLLGFTALLAPFSGLLWLIGSMLRGIGGQTPLRIQRTLARRELLQMMEEGQLAGVLSPSQHRLAQNLISEGLRPLGPHTVPLHRVPTIRRSTTRGEALRAAAKAGVPVVIVLPTSDHASWGYLRVVDLYAQGGAALPTPRTLPILHEGESVVAALLHLRSQGLDVAGVAQPHGDVRGIVFTSELSEVLLRG